METGRNPKVRRVLWAVNAACVLLPVASILLATLGMSLGWTNLATLGLYSVVLSMFASPYMCLLCLVVVVVGVRNNEQGAAGFALILLAINAVYLITYAFPLQAS